MDADTIGFIVLGIVIVGVFFIFAFSMLSSNYENKIEKEEKELEEALEELEELEKVSEAFKMREVLIELKQFAEENNDPIDWNNTSQGKWYICFDMDIKKIDTRYTHTIKRRDIYFSNSEIARQAIEKVGEDRIKKYYLGVDNE